MVLLVSFSNVGTVTLGLGSRWRVQYWMVVLVVLL